MNLPSIQRFLPAVGERSIVAACVLATTRVTLRRLAREAPLDLRVIALPRRRVAEPIAAVDVGDVPLAAVFRLRTQHAAAHVA